MNVSSCVASYLGLSSDTQMPLKAKLDPSDFPKEKRLHCFPKKKPRQKKST